MSCRKYSSFFISYRYEIHRNEDEEIREKRHCLGREKILINPIHINKTYIRNIKKYLSIIERRTIEASIVNRIFYRCSETLRNPNGIESKLKKIPL